MRGQIVSGAFPLGFPELECLCLVTKNDLTQHDPTQGLRLIRKALIINMRS